MFRLFESCILDRCRLGISLFLTITACSCVVARLDKGVVWLLKVRFRLLTLCYFRLYDLGVSLRYFGENLLVY